MVRVWEEVCRSSFDWIGLPSLIVTKRSEEMKYSSRAKHKAWNTISLWELVYSTRLSWLVIEEDDLRLGLASRRTEEERRPRWPNRMRRKVGGDGKEWNFSDRVKAREGDYVLGGLSRRRWWYDCNCRRLDGWHSATTSSMGQIFGNNQQITYIWHKWHIICVTGMWSWPHMLHTQLMKVKTELKENKFLYDYDL
jgi:hypothetical protein